LTKSGKMRWLGQNVQYIVADGEVMEAAAVARDITEVKKADERLRRSEEKYRGILENMELGLMEVDTEGRVVKVYERFCAMSGYTEEELLGKDAKITLLPEEFYSVMKKQEDERAKGKASNYEIQIIRKDGKRLWLLISGTPVYDHEGKRTGSIGIHYDLSKQKNLQEGLIEATRKAEEAQEAEKQFLANMSHEIRTPLNAIIGMTHLLYDTEPTADQQSYLDVLRNSSQILRSLINDLLDLSKIRAGKMEVNQKEFDLTGVVRTIQKTFQIKLDNRPVDVEAEIDQRLDTMVIGDDLLLNQILLNLLGNAEKFTSEGKIGVKVSQKQKEGNQLLVRFEVFDTGIGIPENKRELIFQSFRQVDGETKRKYGGTGLGLSIVKKLVEIQGGKLSVESTLGKGTSFFFELPYEDTEKTPSRIPEEVKSLKADMGGTHHVLMVEDNSMNRRYLGSLLKKWNIGFDIAENGRVGVEKAGERKYDLIFMDVQMPEMDGYEATITIRNTANLNQDTPIVALTASAMLSRKDRAFEIGMNGYVSKPFTPGQILEALHEYLPQVEEVSEVENVMETVAGSPAETEFTFSSSLDVQRLVDLYEDDIEYALDMFEAFSEKMETEYVQLRPLFEEKEWLPLSKLAHKIKPAFPMVGLSDLEANFQALENAGKKEPACEKEISEILNTLEMKVNDELPLIEKEKERLKTFVSKQMTT